MDIQTTLTNENVMPSDKKTSRMSITENESNNILYQAISEHLCCELNGEAVILSLKNGKYYGLNSIGSEIWQLMQKPIGMAKIKKKILSIYNVEPEECALEVKSFLELMKEEGLVEISYVPIAQIRKAAGNGKDTIF